MEFTYLPHSMIVAGIGAIFSSLACELVTATHPRLNLSGDWNYGGILFVAAWIALFVWMLFLFPITLFLTPGAILWRYQFSVPIGFIAGGLFSVGMARYTPDFDLLRPWFYFQILHIPILGGITGAVCAGAFSWCEKRLEIGEGVKWR
jgi:hypothetical protein